MAKAMEPAAIGMEVEILKDDENFKCTGKIVEIKEGGSMVVDFLHTANTFEYEPEEVVLFTDLPW